MSRTAVGVGLLPMYGWPVSLLITVPVFGQHEYTHALVGDLEREGAGAEQRREPQHTCVGTW